MKTKNNQFLLYDLPSYALYSISLFDAFLWIASLNVEYIKFSEWVYKSNWTKKTLYNETKH